jgi:tetratricopeptide (TPR) repeat protein
MAANPVVDKAKKLTKEGKHEEAIAALDAEYKKNPKNAELKTALGDAHTAHGDFFMNNDGMRPMIKYPGALRAYRKAVEIDPNQKKAKENIATIEGIYKSMGRPVPQ